AQAIAILAAGDITASGATAQVSTTGATSDITLIAGAHLVLSGTGTGGNNAATINTSAMTPLNGTQTVAADFGGSATGGNIDLTGSTASTVIKTVGAKATLLAFSTGTTTGRVVLPTGATWAIDTSNSAGNGGAVVITAGAPSGATQPSI